MQNDLRDYDRVKTAPEKGEEELIPSEIVDALLQGENPVKVWREHRGLSQASWQSGLASACLTYRNWKAANEPGRLKC